ncbi:hypothetical protein ACWELJ_27430 [Nocardia sp. NPDC004582]
MRHIAIVPSRRIVPVPRGRLITASDFQLTIAPGSGVVTPTPRLALTP